MSDGMGSFAQKQDARTRPPRIQAEAALSGYGFGHLLETVDVGTGHQVVIWVMYYFGMISIIKNSPIEKKFMIKYSGTACTDVLYHVPKVRKVR